VKKSKKVTFRLLLAALCCLWTAGALRAQAPDRPYVVLVSIDGFRYDYAERFQTKNILAIRDSGAAATMIPSFPTVTFPNHVSIATGLYPQHHGIIGNSFYDPARHADYRMRDAGTDGSWYERGSPLWVLAEQQHMIAACMFWPTCDGEIAGTRPSYWKKYDGSFPNDERVQQVIDWLRLPAEKRPHFITLYFSDVDSAAHRFGAEAPETMDAAQRVDLLIGKLRQGLDALKLPVNLIIVSDHGMQDVNDGEVSVAGQFDSAKIRVELDGPVALIYSTDRDAIESAYAKLRTIAKLDVYKRAETPASWHFRDNARAGDLVAIVKGSAIFTLRDPSDADHHYASKGEHGYDPAKFKTMHAAFFAAGPNVKSGARLGAFENVNVYPFIAKILGLQPPPNLDGSASVLDSVYRP